MKKHIILTYFIFIINIKIKIFLYKKMFEDKIQYTFAFGYDEDEANPLICNEDLFEEKLLT